MIIVMILITILILIMIIVMILIIVMIMTMIIVMIMIMILVLIMIMILVLIIVMIMTLIMIMIVIIMIIILIIIIIITHYRCHRVALPGKILKTITCIKETKNLQINTVMKNNNLFEHLQGENLTLFNDIKNTPPLLRPTPHTRNVST